MDKVERGEFQDLKIVIDGKEYDVDVEKVCSIDAEDLSEEFVRHPSNYAWYATVLSLYESKRDRMEIEVDRLYAQLDMVIREKYRGQKDIKEKQIESEIITDKRYMVLYDEFMDVKSVAKRLGAIVKALEMKKDMLVQLGSRAKKQMELGKFEI